MQQPTIPQADPGLDELTDNAVCLITSPLLFTATLLWRVKCSSEAPSHPSELGRHDLAHLRPSENKSEF
jgi:hypothetical protein